MAKRDRTRRARRAEAAKRKRVADGARINGIEAAVSGERAPASKPRTNATPPGATPARSVAAGSASHSPAMPEAIRRRFIVARNIYYFPGGGRAFVDRGDRLTSRSEKREVIDSLVAIAHARGWRQLTITGTDRFRAQMWLAARLAGLSVRDYAASSHLQGQLARALSRRMAQMAPASVSIEAPESTQDAGAARAPAPREWRGRLIDHGSAPYRHEPTGRSSYFIKLDTAAGEVDVWGVDLKRALQASLSRVARGEEVVLRRVGGEAVRVNAPSAANGERAEDAARLVHRNRYGIETREFWAAREAMAHLVRDPSVSAQAASRRHPELAGTYLKLRAAQLFARRLRHAENQRRFEALVRRGLAAALERGEPLRSVRLRTRAAVREPRMARSAPDASRGRG
ncbi:LPD7 domain-containing protein [Steroidobacter flavus]|uniref:LPD7 domain-containing protein n=1 Tax=Steroidobacter flavus TaxID=1842136 RepID=A0ABV8SVP6_9GAMM